ncbi:MAG: triphosphoribosyl-dephospho-CoA synthase [Methylophilaceae bacterium]
MSGDSLGISSRLAAAFKSACLAELEALKPGNVHIFADGHGMVVQDFVRSAEAAAEAIAEPNAVVGERIFSAMEATWTVVGCNTNLGIILLCAPLIHAVLQGHKATLRERLRDVLQELTVADAQLTYQAIVRASPAGLGESAQHDVHMPPQVTLLEAMREAQHRDCIARQYANGYADVFDIGVKRYREAMQQWGCPTWAATRVYLAFLAEFPDTHIVRKYGDVVAQMVRVEAKGHEQTLLAQENPTTCQRELLKFDADLKARGLNPGTSADLTVASMLAVSLENDMASMRQDAV